VSRATVYRTIDVLVKHKMLNKLDIGDGRRRYENRVNYSHHDHLICINCGIIEEFVDNRIEKLQEKVAKKHGFTLTRHNHQLFGLCSSCQKDEQLLPKE
jgi:Fur family ferric uptake transcriptional regulator